MSNKVRLAGVGMIPFTKPGQSEDWDVMAERAVRLALADAGLDYGRIQRAFAGYVYGDSTLGQSALYRVGITGIPIVNVNNNCSTGSTALYLAREAVEMGAADCVLALGFEQMAPGALGMYFQDRKPPMEKPLALLRQLQGVDPKAPIRKRRWQPSYSAAPEWTIRAAMA
jgi:sterol carrier protein 2